MNSEYTPYSQKNTFFNGRYSGEISFLPAEYVAM